MKQTLLVVLCLFASSGFGALNIGDPVPNMCWLDDKNETVCLEDSEGAVRVLLFNAGWCPPCNTHLSMLAPAVGKYDEDEVVFISLSLAAWSTGSPPTVDFLRQWRLRHSIPFIVAAGKRMDMELLVNPPLYIPTDAIIDQKGDLSYVKVNPSVSELFAHIDSLL